jgi:hypothetical protein
VRWSSVHTDREPPKKSSSRCLGISSRTATGSKPASRNTGLYSRAYTARRTAMASPWSAWSTSSRSPVLRSADDGRPGGRLVVACVVGGLVGVLAACIIERGRHSTRLVVATPLPQPRDKRARGPAARTARRHSQPLTVTGVQQLTGPWSLCRRPRRGIASPLPAPRRHRQPLPRPRLLASSPPTRTTPFNLVSKILFSGEPSLSRGTCPD